MAPNAPLDDLIARLRDRAAAPEARVDVAPSAFASSVRALPVTDLASRVADLRGDLSRLVETSRRGEPVDPRLVARADAFGASMSERMRRDVAPPPDGAKLARAEAALGFALPIALRRVYLEVGNGGFGPGTGLLAIERVVEAYRDFRKEPADPGGAEWPEKLLPVVHHDPRYECVDASSGAVVTWDPEEIEPIDRRGWARSFRTAAPSVEAWLDGWLRARPGHRRTADLMHAAKVAALRESLARVRAMTPERRAEIGFSDGWEERMIRASGVDPSEL